MLLHSVSGLPIATILSQTLEEIVLDPEVLYYVRRLAGDALSGLPKKSDEWARIFSELHDLADESSLRIAIELLPSLGFLGPTDNQLVELIVALSGLSICAFPQTGETRLSGALWWVKKWLPENRIEPVLNILADYLNALLGDDYDRFEDSDAINVVYALTERRLELGKVDPLRLWKWLSSFGDCRDFRDESQKAISDWLKNNNEARRRIQRFVLLEEADSKTVWMRGWRLSDLLIGLNPDEHDIVELLGCLDPSSEALEDRWKDLVRLCPHDEERGECVRDAAAPFATEQEGQEFLERLANPEVPEWQIKQDKRENEKQKLWAEHRANFLNHIDELRDGKYCKVVKTAQAYLNLYSNMGNDVPAHERIEQWLGPELQAAAFQGFEAYLSDVNSKPTAQEIADSFAESKRWSAAYIFVAAAAERVRNGKSFDYLSDERLLAVFLEIRLNHTLDHAKIDHVTEVLEQAVKNRSGLWQAFWRLRIEPQLAAQNEHVDGLYEIVRGTDVADTVVDLATEWLERFPKQSHRTEVELLDCLIVSSKFELLKKHVNDRRKSNVTDEERRSDWDVVAFLVDYENVQTQLAKRRGKDPDFLWHLRSRLGRHRHEGLPAPLSAAQLSWIIKNFRAMWPNVTQPSGVSSGDRNPWNATVYIGDLINRLGGLTSSDAAKELSALRDEPGDGYTDHLKSAFAEQAQKVVEENYTPPTIAEVKSALSDGPPCSADQLQAVMLEELTVAQGKIRSHPGDWYGDFFTNGAPKDEEACRDTLLKMFGDYPYGILCEPEGHLANDKRVDIKCTIDQLMLPIEIKGQWHKDLWHAADTQLDRLYSNDWRAERKGIYLVFWFGPNVPQKKKLKSLGNGRNRPNTADELRLALIESSEVAKKGLIEVVVLDMVRP